jgi:hypothetical protein
MYPPKLLVICRSLTATKHREIPPPVRQRHQPSGTAEQDGLTRAIEHKFLVWEVLDLVVEGADLDAEGTNQEGIAEGSSSERETAREEKGRCTVARRSSEATRRVASSHWGSSGAGQRRRKGASHSLGESSERRAPTRSLGSDEVPKIFFMERTRI